MTKTTIAGPEPIAVQRGVSAAPAPATPIDPNFYETQYQQAQGEIAQTPWSLGAPNPALVSWLNAQATSLVRPGCRVVVVGCGLGDDAIELSHRGFDVTAFDLSPTAIQWAQQRFPQESQRFCVADVCSPPSHWRHRLDLVVDISTLSGVAPEHWAEMARGAADLLHPNGVMLIICAGRGDDEPAKPLDGPVSGPPYPLTADELRQLLACNGLTLIGELEDLMSDRSPPRRFFLGAFGRCG